ncbi:hypothetical protein PPL_05610 [Heterostelium album PN500]|uniref:Deoxyhypusine hydroxylase n=1 Tax=Heterostelium pallidum (strain ATCC 26659 / Pp 5 / PN500) TaxID=670386 RepID=D3BAN2_HETP5|nr:hypothetical protein PPL_05610 [Heterostelium album PN500]EFA81619.1 hypothetical protein PPL_05610 [Heterostelium album PN500]|eukprot:XP_020433736.1 hypothetical protein PPL_05610 [Heterostelium album PN500]
MMQNQHEEPKLIEMRNYLFKDIRRISTKNEDMYRLYERAKFKVERWRCHDDTTNIEDLFLLNDVRDWQCKLDDNERYLISNILGFFVSIAGIINENIITHFMSEVQIPEARTFYSMQIAMENIQSEKYSLLIDAYIKDTDEKSKIFNAIESIPCVKRKCEWLLKSMNNSKSLAERLIAFAAVESILYSASFCVILWFHKRSLMPKLSEYYSFIVSNEYTHCEFGRLLYSKLINKLDTEMIESIIRDAVDCEKQIMESETGDSIFAQQHKIEVTPEVVNHLKSTLTDVNQPIAKRFRSLFTLRNLGGRLSIDAMCSALKDDSALLRHEIAYCLGQMTDSHAVDQLITIVGDQNEHPMVRHEAAEALGAIGDTTAYDTLRQHANDITREVAETCQLALSRLEWYTKNEPESVENKSYLSVDPAPSLPTTVPFEEVKKDFLNGELDIFNRYRALFSLRDRGDEASVLALCDGFNDESALLKHEVAFVLGQLQHRAALPALTTVLRDAKESAMVRHEAAEALGAIASTETVPLLEEFVKDAEPIVSESCLIALDVTEYFNNTEEFQYADGIKILLEKKMEIVYFFSIHCRFSCLLHSKLINKLDAETIESIIRDAVDFMVIYITGCDRYHKLCQDHDLNRSSNNNNNHNARPNNCFNSGSMVIVKPPQEPPSNSNNNCASGSSDSCLLTRVTFKVDTPLGELPANQVVAIIGDSLEIGNWNVKGSIELQVTEQNDTHLVWTTTIIFPTSTKINYKYIVVNKSRVPSLLVEWEAAKGSSRSITVEGKDMFVNDGIFGVLGSASQPWIGRGWLPENETQLRVQLQVDENPVKLYNENYSQANLILRIHDPYGLSQDFQLPLLNYSELVLHAPSVEQLGFSASIIAINQNGASSPGILPGELIGRVFIISSQITNKWGKISAPILTEKGIIGEFRCNFIVVLPFVHPLNSLSVLWHSFVEHPNSLIGHRGNGKNNFGINTSAVTENTILSFLTAARFGAKMIEFDLQLTYDNVPVIFHNYEIDIETSEGVIMQETINRLTLEQFLRLKPQKKVDQISNAISHMKKHRLSRSTGDLFSVSDKDSFNPLLSTTQPYSNVIHDRYSTFQEAFTFVPHDVGFMVEIKYPNLLMQNLRKFSAPERNEFVDIILNIVFNEAGERRIAFLTFDPDIAILLRTKQFRYPVLFLVCSDTPSFYSVFDPDVNVNDSRGNSILNAVSFVKTVNLDGIVCDSESILQNHSFVKTVHQENLLLFTYGSKNVDANNVKIQNDLGVDGIIADNLTKLSKKLREEENSIVSAALV